VNAGKGLFLLGLYSIQLRTAIVQTYLTENASLNRRVTGSVINVKIDFFRKLLALIKHFYIENETEKSIYELNISFRFIC